MKGTDALGVTQSLSRRTVILVACLVVGIAAGCLRHGRWAAVAWVMQGCAAVMLAVASRKLASPPEPQVGQPTAPATHRRTGLIVAGCGACAVLASSLAVLTSWQRWTVTGMLIFPPGLAMLALGLDLTAGWPAWWVGVGGRLRRHSRRPASWLFAAIVVLGAAFRLASFGDFPPLDGFASIEEAQAGQIALNITTTEQRPWEWPTSQYLSAACFRITGPGLPAHRLLAVLLGCLTVPAFYLLARTFVSVPSALIATALLAVSRWPVQTSWYNDPVFTPLLAFTLGLGLLLRSSPDRRPSLVVGAAAMAGMSFFEYVTFRPLLAIAVVVIVSRLRSAYRDGARRKHATAFAGTLLLFLPAWIGAFRSGYPSQLIEPFLRNASNREYYTSDAGSFVRLRLERLAVVADGFTVRDHGTFFGTLNTDETPLLDPVTGVLFVVGLGVALLQARRRGHVLLVGSFLLLLFGCTVVTQNYDFRRLAVLVPFVFLLVAVASEVILSLLEGAQARRFGVACVAALALAAACWNADFLFRKLARDHAARAGHRNDYTTAAFFLNRHWRGERVVLLTPDDDFYPFNFFDVTDYKWLLPAEVEGCVVPTLDQAFEDARSGTTPLLLIVQRPFPLEEIVVEVPRRFPSADCSLHPDPDDESLDLATCRVAGAGGL
ncbi:MAG: glycosyltransferase family 39 protein [Acidobacteriia bacterium]|nr:glycosyltransferase family 39 protein [Terriglobia bacterium]